MPFDRKEYMRGYMERRRAGERTRTRMGSAIIIAVEIARLAREEGCPDKNHHAVWAWAKKNPGDVDALAAKTWRTRREVMMMILAGLFVPVELRDDVAGLDIEAEELYRLCRQKPDRQHKIIAWLKQWADGHNGKLMNVRYANREINHEEWRAGLRE